MTAHINKGPYVEERMIVEESRNVCPLERYLLSTYFLDLFLPTLGVAISSPKTERTNLGNR